MKHLLPKITYNLLKANLDYSNMASHACNLKCSSSFSSFTTIPTNHVRKAIMEKPYIKKLILKNYRQLISKNV